MATSDGTVAVKVGYSFALVPGSELLHTASKDDRCYDLDSESRDMEAASDELGRTGKNGIDGRDDR